MQRATAKIYLLVLATFLVVVYVCAELPSCIRTVAPTPSLARC